NEENKIEDNEMENIGETEKTPIYGGNKMVNTIDNMMTENQFIVVHSQVDIADAIKNAIGQTTTSIEQNKNLIENINTYFSQLVNFYHDATNISNSAKNGNGLKKTITDINDAASFTMVSKITEFKFNVKKDRVKLFVNINNNGFEAYSSLSKGTQIQN
ncbi:hypothetical protein K9K83_03685, partial [Candidatus Woesearchaeota archaeon]|nr:hypothetical protein [Candidatus Woesearchaeota archaeon]